MTVISGLIVLGLVWGIPNYLVQYFKISPTIQLEAKETFRLLTIAIPIVTTTTALRGIPEAYQEFFMINIVRIFLGVATFLAPLIILFLVNSLFWVVVGMLVIRSVVWFLYYYQIRIVNKKILQEIKLDIPAVRPILSFSMWVTVVNIVGPIIAYSDRFIIGHQLTASAITYYSTPYEVVSKVLLISGALTGVLFPAFSLSFFSDREKAIALLRKSLRYIYVILYPIIFIIVLFAHDVLRMWLGTVFADRSTIVMQFLALGIFVNSLGAIPNNFFSRNWQATNPDIHFMCRTALLFICYVEFGSILGDKWGCNELFLYGGN